MNFQIVIIAVVILAALGALFGLVLGFAAKVFAVEVDPKEEAVLGCLPGANCGGCGFAGCSGYAAAVAKGAAPVNACAAGGEAVAAQIAEIMGVSAGAMVKQLAQVHCTGCGQNYKQYEYVGLHDCVAASKVPGGGALSCAYGCLGLGSCEKACPFDAIHVIDGVAKVDEEKCKACGKCVDICPRVHHHGAPQGAGDAVGELQAGETPAQGGHGQPGQRDAALRPQTAVDLPGLLQAGGLEDKAVEAAVRHQQVAAVAQEEGGHPLRRRQAHRRRGLLPALGQGHEPGRAADAEGGVVPHGLLLPQFQAGQLSSQLARQLFQSLHSGLLFPKLL